MAANEWDGERARRWVRQAERLDRQLRPVSDALFGAAALAEGDTVLDVGCGTGPTTRRAAALVGPAGRVVGIDISTDMLDAARLESRGDDLAPIEWIEADAVRWQPDPGAFDAVISRFGVMFFSDPTAAFANLARAARPGGRLAMAVWQRRTASPSFEVPLQATLGSLREQGISVEEPPEDQGPFSLHDLDAVSAVLDGTGWTDIEWVDHEAVMTLDGGAPPDVAARTCVDFGPTRVVLADQPPEVTAAAVDAIAAAFAEHADADGHVALLGRFAIVTARHQEIAARN